MGHKKRLPLILAALLCLNLSACGMRNVTRGMEEGEQYDAVISVKGKDSAEEASGTALRSQLDAIKELLGKTDGEAAGLLGGGAENQTADGSYLIGRNYEAALFSESAPVYTSYDADGKVSLVVAELSGQEAEGYAAQLSGLFGETESLEDGEGRSWSWETDGAVFTLYEAEGAVSLDVALPDRD